MISKPCYEPTGEFCEPFHPHWMHGNCKCFDISGQHFSADIYWFTYWKPTCWRHRGLCRSHNSGWPSALHCGRLRHLPFRGFCLQHTVGGYSLGLFITVKPKWIFFTITVLKPGPLGDFRNVSFYQRPFGSQLSLVGGLPPFGGQSRLFIGKDLLKFGVSLPTLAVVRFAESGCHVGFSMLHIPCKQADTIKHSLHQ